MHSTLRIAYRGPPAEALVGTDRRLGKSTIVGSPSMPAEVEVPKRQLLNLSHARVLRSPIRVENGADAPQLNGHNRLSQSGPRDRRSTHQPALGLAP
jgi:hypothetical protein